MVRSILEAIPGYRVIGEASDGLEAVERAATLLPDVVLLDMAMPLLNGIEAAKRIKQACPRSKIIFLTQQNDDEVRSAALATGAEAYLVKSRAAGELLPTIETALLNGLEVYEPISQPSYDHAPKLTLQPPQCDLLTSLWRRFPVTIIILAIVIGAWIDHQLEHSTAVDLRTARSYGARQSAPLASLKPMPGIHRLDKRTGGSAKESKAALFAFKRVQVGPNEVDYVAEDVTMRVFTPRSARVQPQHVSREVNIGDDVTVRYFASEPAERSSPLSK